MKYPVIALLVIAFGVCIDAAPHHIKEAYNVPSNFKNGVKWELRTKYHTPEFNFNTAPVYHDQVYIHRPTYNWVRAHQPTYTHIAQPIFKAQSYEPFHFV